MRLLEKKAKLYHRLVSFKTPLDRSHAMKANLPSSGENLLSSLWADWITAIQDAIDC
jgi:hypothetical protein